MLIPFFVDAIRPLENPHDRPRFTAVPADLPVLIFHHNAFALVISLALIEMACIIGQTIFCFSFRFLPYY
jgi:hypothetical protein